MKDALTNGNLEKKRSRLFALDVRALIGIGRGKMLEVNKVYCMDCLEGFKQLEDNSIDLIVTDPPYNIGKDFENDNLPKKEYLDWCKKWIKESNRVVKHGGAIWITLGWQRVAEIKVLFDKEQELRLKNWVIWYRQDGWKGDKGFAQSHEHILYFIKSPVSEDKINEFRNYLNLHRKKENLTLSKINNLIGSAITGGGKASCYMGDKQDKEIPHPEDYNKLKEILKLDSSFDDLVFNKEKYIKFNKVDECNDLWLTPKSEHKRLGHPTQKPEALFRRIIKVSSDEGDIVLDPFMGSGTTGFASKSLKRNFIGFEIDKKYCDIINKRLSQEVLNL